MMSFYVTTPEAEAALIKENNYLWELSLCLEGQYKRIPLDYHWKLFDIARELMEDK